jgi:hypothetical protein
MTKQLSGCMASIAIFAVCLSTAAMAEQMADKGVLHLTSVKEETIPSPFNNGGTLTLSQSTGKFEATDGKHPLNGADVSTVNFSDVTRGNGTVQIWTTLTKDGSASYTKAVAEVKTTKGADGKSITSATGTYEKVGGTGSFAGLKGSGNFARKVISPTTYEVEINGYMEQP